ncbi:hypothetical protein NIES4102_17770 [Chondrocystis sp. NIES-4102]|nr:hypothetical protein NIES4102_17770 [Chondrocystis sp. NIES-4102]
MKWGVIPTGIHPIFAFTLKSWLTNKTFNLDQVKLHNKFFLQDHPDNKSV